MYNVVPFVRVAIEDRMERGETEEEAKNAVLREFGNVSLIKEVTRDMWGWRALEQLAQDLRFGARMLGKRPGFTLVALITLALGIGANTAIFSVVNAALLRPLPFEAADRLVWVWDSNPSLGLPRFPSSGPNFEDWREQSESFDYIAAFTGWSFNLTGEGEPERIQGAMGSTGLFPMLGIRPVVGRLFSPEEEKAGSHRVALISHGLWQRRFGAEPAIIDSSLTLNGESYTVIGVLPAGLRILPYEADIWTPLALDVLRAGRGSHFLSVIARLKPGVSVEQAQAEMNEITSGLQREYPNSNTGWTTELQPLHERIVGEVRATLLTLLGAVTFVLLIACANVANLLMARAAARQKEVAIRTALGAGRSRLVRQFLTESLLLALIGGGLGLALAAWGVDQLAAFNLRDIPRAEEVSIDGRVLAFTLLASLATGIVFGLVSALQGSKVDLNSSLKEASRAVSPGLHHNRARSLMVVLEISLAMVLLVGAGLMIKSLLRLSEVALGFDPENVLTMHISLPQSKYAEKSRRAAFCQELLQRVQRLPGVQSAGTVSPLPLTGGSRIDFFIEGRPTPAPNQGFNTNLHLCSPDYFRTMRIPLLKGRFFDERDTAQSQPVVVINETFARRFWPDEDPLGKRVSFSGEQGPWSVIVGVVGDIRHLRLDADAGLEMYQPYPQSPIPYVALVARSDLSPSAVAGLIKGEVLGLDSSLPVYSIRPMRQIISGSVAPRRFQMILLGSFAGIALMLAAVGIYGVTSYSVSQRTHEIGIRVALGARSGDVLKMVIGQGMRLALAGITAGLIGAFALTRLIEGLLFGVSATDPVTFLVIAMLLTAVSLLACYVPARRAMKVDPLVALRSE